MSHDHIIGAEGMSERRTDRRRRVFKGATLSFNNGYGAMECVVRNESEHGAQLSFGETSAVPAAFNMAIRGEAAKRAARVRWRTLTTVGISYD